MKALYQDHGGKFVWQVHSARIGGRDYTFAASFAGTNGVHAYDMTAARAFSTNPCVSPNNTCAGVYQGRVGNADPAKYVTGVGVGNRYFIAKSGGTSALAGVQIWEVTNPAVPSLVVSDLVGGGNFVNGLAMWSQGGHQYLGLHAAKGAAAGGRIYDVTTCLASGCANLGAPVWQQSLYGWADSGQWLSATFSRSGTIPTLYFGNSDSCAQGEANALQKEYLFDVSSAANPVEITPNGTTVDGGMTVDYWSWYYNNAERGFTWVAPRSGKFNGAYFYRAATSLFDIHEWTARGLGAAGLELHLGGPPQQVIRARPVDFTDTSTGSPISWSWTFEGGTPGTSNSREPSGRDLRSTGPKNVSLQAFNNAGPGSTANQTIQVLDPAPVIGGFDAASPANPFVCQPVTFTATGITGQPPLTHTWRVRQGNDDPNGIDRRRSGGTTTTPSSGPFRRDRLPGFYSGELTSATGWAPPPAWRGQRPGTPGASGAGRLRADQRSFAAGTVQFHLNVAGRHRMELGFRRRPGLSRLDEQSDQRPEPAPHLHRDRPQGRQGEDPQLRRGRARERDPRGQRPRDHAARRSKFHVSTLAHPRARSSAFRAGTDDHLRRDVARRARRVQYDWNGDGFGSGDGDA